MGWVDATSVGSLTAATAAALLTAALSPISCDGVTPLVSELICWLLVLTVIRLFPLPSLNRSNNHGVAFAAAPTYTYWIIASSIAATAVSSSFFDATWSIVSSPLSPGSRQAANKLAIAFGSIHIDCSIWEHIDHAPTGMASWKLPTFLACTFDGCDAASIGCAQP